MADVITFGGWAIYCYLGLLCWVAVFLVVRTWIVRGVRERRAHRVRWDSTEAEVSDFADDLHRWRVSDFATGEQPIVADPVTYGRRRRPVAPRMTRTVVPVAPPPAWAAGYQPGPITREFARIVGTEFPTWTQAELDLEAVS